MKMKLSTSLRRIFFHGKLYMIITENAIATKLSKNAAKNFFGIEIHHSKHDHYIGPLVNGSGEINFSSFVLDKQFGQGIIENPLFTQIEKNLITIR